MYSYVNKINVGSNQDKSEVILNFIQETPKFGTPKSDENGTVSFETSIESNKVADIVVTGEFAREMAKLILSVLED